MRFDRSSKASQAGCLARLWLVTQDVNQAVDQVREVAPFCDVLAVSNRDSNVVQQFAPYITAGQTCAFIGSSGVGKSTLINLLLAAGELATQEIGRNDKGRHTTTAREMFSCPLGGVLIDTPGMREMGAENPDLAMSFGDIDELSRECRFANCTHTSEPGCAVRAALERGELDLRRLESYQKLRLESSYDGMSSKEIESVKMQRLFKDVGGMRNARKFAKSQNRRKG